MASVSDRRMQGRFERHFHSVLLSLITPAVCFVAWQFWQQSHTFVKFGASLEELKSKVAELSVERAVLLPRNEASLEFLSVRRDADEIRRRVERLEEHQARVR